MLGEYCERVEQGQGLAVSEASQALHLILESNCSDGEIERLLLGLARKEESVEEIVGFARVMRELSVKIHCRQELFVDTAGTGGGAPTFNISTAAAFVIAGAGVAVAKHGNRAITSSSGSADVLAELGVRIDCPPSLCQRALNEIGICFMFAPLFHPAMKRVGEIRRRLGRRTIFNMLGPLTNPASAPYQVIGVYAKELTEKLAGALKQLGSKRAWVVHSADGLDEVSVAAATYVAEIDQDDEEVSVFEFKPLEKHLTIPCGGSPAANARIIRGVLEGTLAGPARDIVILNAAAAIHVATGDNLTPALEAATESLRSGRARRKLEELIEFQH